MGWLLCLILSLTDQWVLGPSLFVLLLGWHLLLRDPGPPVAGAAFTYQWLQVTVALFYLAISGRRIADLEGLDPTRMVLVGLAAVAAFFGSYYWVVEYRRKKTAENPAQLYRAAPLSLIAMSYVVAIFVNFPLQRLAWSLPAITQILVLLSFARYCLLYVLMTRLLKPMPSWSLIVAIVAVEVILGFTGYFADFKESLIFVVLAIMGAADRRRATTWIAGGAMALFTLAAAVTWTAIKPLIRVQYSYSASAGERLTNVAAILAPALKASTIIWKDQVDRLVSRIWMIRHPALALERVPAEVPHENGKLLRGAISNTVMPRMFFTDKGVLPSSSEMVRKYSGVYVAGRERRTSYAFGYATESYVDFGWPWMLVPIMVFGGLLGAADRLMRTVLRNSDIRDGVRVVVLWSTMYAFEVSWVFMLGTALGLLIVLVGGGILFEKAFNLSRPATGPITAPRQPRLHRRQGFPSPLGDPTSSATALPEGSRSSLG